jgi:16S rRNA (cytosine967-C5)-methyltransferase
VIRHNLLKYVNTILSLHLVLTQDPRHLALTALRTIYRGAFADVALEKVLSQADVIPPDRRLITELVYGISRRQRTLDALVHQLTTRKGQRQPLDLRLVLHLGLYQLRYLSHIPPSAAVNTTVNVAKRIGLGGLAGLVNGILRQYLRLVEDLEHPQPSVATNLAIDPRSAAGRSRPDQVHGADPLVLPMDPVDRLGVLHSYPDWIVKVWLQQMEFAQAEQLCAWMNLPPHLDLRVNSRRTDMETVMAAMAAAGIAVSRVPHVPWALRLDAPSGAVQQLPGYAEGWWMVQDASAQLVSYLVDPQPGDRVVDACAAPGGKTMHLAELMGDRGVVEACDLTSSRLHKLHQNAKRLGLQSIQACLGDSRMMPQFVGQCDRVLLDAPCSGLGTLHRHADARWRQTPESVQELGQLQRQLLESAVTWVKPQGILVYSTCTLHPTENEDLIRDFLSQHPDWQIEPPAPNSAPAAFAAPEGWLKVWPHRHNMDGFFMVRLRRH